MTFASLHSRPSFHQTQCNMKHFRIVLITVVFITTLTAFENKISKTEQPLILSRSVKIIEVAGLKFKDLNKNEKLDAYEDWRLTASQRSKDLLSKMSLEVKV